MPRKRDYQAERVKRDAKYQQVFNPITGRNYTGYNEYETQRRNRKARSKGYKNYSTKRRIERLHDESPSKYLARTLTGQLSQVNDLEELMDLAGVLDWDYFRWLYSNLNTAN